MAIEAFANGDSILRGSLNERRQEKCTLSWLGAQFVGGKWLDVVEHVALQERGRKKICLDVDQSYMACYGWNRILCGMHWIANGINLVPKICEGKWRGNNLPMRTFVLSKQGSTRMVYQAPTSYRPCEEALTLYVMCLGKDQVSHDILYSFSCPPKSSSSVVNLTQLCGQPDTMSLQA
jgi:hypothetical protein